MDPMSSSAPSAHWWRQLRPRVTTLWQIKAASNTLGMMAFFAAYFWVLRNPQFEVTMMPLTAIDRWVGFAPAAMPLYVSLWVYVSLPLALLRTRAELLSYGVATLALSASGLTIFLLWPTAAPAFDIDWSQHPSVEFLKTVDLSGNACPSLHVAFAVFTMVWLDRLLREMSAGTAWRIVNLVWCVGILYSTLAVRQHVAIDVAAGAALGAAVVALQLRALNRAQRRHERSHPAAATPVRHPA